MNDSSERPLPVRPVMPKPPWARARRRHGTVLGVICGLCLIGSIVTPRRIRTEEAEWPADALGPVGPNHYYFGWPWEAEHWRPDPWALILGGIAVVSVFLPNPVRALCLVCVGLGVGFVAPLCWSILVWAQPPMSAVWPDGFLYGHFAGLLLLPLAALTQGGLLAFLRHPRAREGRRLVLVPAIAATVLFAGLIVLAAFFDAMRWPPHSPIFDTQSLAEEDAKVAVFVTIERCAYGLLAAALLIGLLAGGLRKRWLARIGLIAGLTGLALIPIATGATVMRFQLLTLTGSVVHGWPAYYAGQLFDIAVSLATLGLILVGYAALWLLDPKREHKEPI